MAAPDLDSVRAAHARIRAHVHRTPVLTSTTFDRELGAQLFFKCENLQKVGAFKARGAVNAVLSLDDAALQRGVLTHSSGNHAAALAYAASLRSAPCVVVMPRSAAPIKVAAVRGYGAEIVFCDEGQRAETAQRVQGERGLTFVSPFDQDTIVAGQGTAALELLEDVPDLDIIIAPVGGGGLLAGTALAARAAEPAPRVFGAEPAAVDDAYHSLRSGERQPAVANPQTWADGLLTGLGELNFAILKQRGVQVVRVEEDAMLRAARDVLQRMKLLIEPSSATVLAAVRAQRAAWAGLRIGAIISGGNTDLAWLAAVDGAGD